MRAIVLVFAAAIGMLIAPAAIAAPGCMEGMSGASHCAGIQDFALSTGDRNAILAICIFFAFLCLVALLPDFDGTDDEDWDTHGGDDFWRH